MPRQSCRYQETSQWAQPLRRSIQVRMEPQYRVRLPLHLRRRSVGLCPWDLPADPFRSNRVVYQRKLECNTRRNNPIRCRFTDFPVCASERINRFSLPVNRLRCWPRSWAIQHLRPLPGALPSELLVRAECSPQREALGARSLGPSAELNSTSLTSFRWLRLGSSPRLQWSRRAAWSGFLKYRVRSRQPGRSRRAEGILAPADFTPLRPRFQIAGQFQSALAAQQTPSPWLAGSPA